MSRHLMIDLESLGVLPGCAVLSLGAVEFNEEGQFLGHFHAHITLESCVKRGLKIEAGTVMWWLTQERAAQQALTDAEGHPLHEVLEAFIGTFNWQDLKVWANGASFDFPILVQAFEACGFKKPWAYYNEMDFRTMKNLVPKAEFDALRVRPELAHDALSDAKAQAQTLINIFSHSNKNGGLRVAA